MFNSLVYWVPIDAFCDMDELIFFVARSDHDSFDKDEVRAKHEILKTPQKQDILSPQHSRSISSKFRKPGS